MTAVAEQVESASMSVEGFIGRIPVRNLWLLMLYASDLFRTRGIGKIGLEDSPDSRIVQRKDLAHRCRALAGGTKAMGVSGDAPNRAQMSTDRFGRHDADDRFMVAAAKLAFDLVLPAEASGANVLPLPDREATWVRRLFERAVGGFYEVVLSPRGWRVLCGGTMGWQIEQKTAGIDKILPTMRADVVLDHPSTSQRIVIDVDLMATPADIRAQLLRLCEPSLRSPGSQQ